MSDKNYMIQLDGLRAIAIIGVAGFSYAPFSSNALNIITSGILYGVLSLLIATISWFLFEKPINDLKRYFSYSKHKNTSTFPPVVKVEVVV